MRRWRESNKGMDLTCFPNSELDSESDEGGDYRYKHKYETLI